MMISPVDADFKLKDMKREYKEWDMKRKGYKKRLDELQTAFKSIWNKFRLIWWIMRRFRLHWLKIIPLKLAL
ncbi:hypothetical protein QN277_020599 [Acacia crassicarpa]|uniref:Uncharacterized protein n=1 Tax=Acacia crassicarpa TaxID=499986 RepID=A0AAE1JK45_9FABA|nr:hypothetical protein QN277_020599 [Acacia crassicarpa]